MSTVTPERSRRTVDVKVVTINCSCRFGSVGCNPCLYSAPIYRVRHTSCNMGILYAIFHAQLQARGKLSQPCGCRPEYA